MDTQVQEVDQTDLLGETVFDSVSGMQAEVEGFDSATGMYRVRLQSSRADQSGKFARVGEDSDPEPYEDGHACWRRPYELTVVAAPAADPQELAISAENEVEIELLVSKGYAGLIAAALLGDEEATRKVRAMLAGIGEP